MTRMLDLIPRTSSFLPGRDFFDRFFAESSMSDLFGETSQWLPAFDVTESEKEYVVHAELPGVDVKDLDVSLSEGILTVTGEKKHEHEEKEESYHRIERSYGTFSRSFRIPEEIKMRGVDATYKDGVLTITLPKAGTRNSKTKKIHVK